MAPSLVILPDDLIAEVLSFLHVKFLLRFRCVSKSWKTLISDPAFVKLHLKKSQTRNPLFTLITHHMKNIPGESPYGSDDECEMDYSVVPYPICHLLDKPSFTLFDDPYYHLDNKGCSHIVGTSNGLILLAGDSFGFNDSLAYWLCVWNPSTRTTSTKFGYFREFGKRFNFAFGCDNLTNTYKVVASRCLCDQLTTEVRVLSLGDDNVWRNIESFPVIPLHLDYDGNHDHEGVYLSDTINWLAIHNDFRYHIKDIKNIKVEQFVIVSLDLGMETYNQYLLPCGFDEVPPAEPTIGVLGDCLCFSYSYKETEFVIWKMNKFGLEDSWSQFLKISYKNLQIYYDFSVGVIKYHFQLVPLLLSDDGDTLILRSSQEREAILYHWRDNRVQRTKITPSRTITDNRVGDYVSWGFAKGYVESLVPIF